VVLLHVERDGRVLLLFVVNDRFVMVARDAQGQATEAWFGRVENHDLLKVMRHERPFDRERHRGETPCTGWLVQAEV